MTERGESTENLDRVLRDFRTLSGDMESCAVLSRDGELLSSSHGAGVDRERATAMLAALVDLAARTARENGKDHTSQTRIKTEEGYVLLVRLQDGSTLAAMAGPEARDGLVLYDMRAVRPEVEAALERRRQG